MRLINSMFVSVVSPLLRFSMIEAFPVWRYLHGSLNLVGEVLISVIFLFLTFSMLGLQILSCRKLMMELMLYEAKMTTYDTSSVYR